MGGIVELGGLVEGLIGSISFLNLYVLVRELPLDLSGHGECMLLEPDLEPRVCERLVLPENGIWSIIFTWGLGSGSRAAFDYELDGLLALSDFCELRRASLRRPCVWILSS